jgi:medium-chain acyl-[acyl-carrier-protein] hydrolase
LVLPAIKADFAAYETYRYSAEAPLDCPITAMGGTKDPSVSPHELKAWGEQTSIGFATRLFPGDHFFIHSARQLLTWTIAQELLPARLFS